jgi:hypothetical protein
MRFFLSFSRLFFALLRFGILYLCAFVWITANGLEAQSKPYATAANDSTRAATERYAKARIWFSDALSMADAEEEGVEIEHSFVKGSLYVEAVVSYYTLERLKARGARIEILEANAEEAAARNLEEGIIALQEAERARRADGKRDARLSSDAPQNFRLGSLGGYYKLDEIYGEFAKMRDFAPEIVGAPEEIGKSAEGRPLYVYRFCTESAASAAAPEILYTALHHAREPGSVSTLTYFLWTLLERYRAGDAEARYLLRQRQLYVAPVLNPDGYLFNELNFPRGGGMWRKNRSANADGSFGVDLNRNYGTFTFWNANNNGSSTNPRSDTYRGVEPFSEPETRAIRDFCLRRNFVFALNYHTFSNLLIYPYSYVDSETPDSTLFRAFAAEITRKNLYSAGRDLQTVGYAVRGSSDDWMYAGVSGRRILALTPEVGTIEDGFWARADRIYAHGAENLVTNFTTAWSAGANVRPTQVFTAENPQTGVTRIIVEIQNIGARAAEAGSGLRLRPLRAAARIIRPERALLALRPAEETREVFDCVFDSMFQNGDMLSVEIVVTQEGVERRDTIAIQAWRAERRTLFAAEQDWTRWSSDFWGVERDAQTGRDALSDSPRRNYAPNRQNFVRLREPVSLRNVRAASLEFQTRWSIESNGDLGVAQISEDDGRTWTTLRTDLMKPSPRFRDFPFGFDGNFPQWIRQECSLNDFIGRDILLRFGLLSDGNGEFDGILISDVALRLYRDSAASPSPPDDAFTEPRLLPNAIAQGQDARIEFPLGDVGRLADIRVVSAIGQTLALERGTRIPDEGVARVRLPFLPKGLYIIEIVVSDDSPSAAPQQQRLARARLLIW